MIPALDPVGLAADLIRRPSVTPADAGVLEVLAAALESVGFTCTRLPFSEAGTPDIANLFAKLGSGGRHFSSPAIPTWSRPAMPRPGASTRSAAWCATAGCWAAVRPT